MAVMTRRDELEAIELERLSLASKGARKLTGNELERYEQLAARHATLTLEEKGHQRERDSMHDRHTVSNPAFGQL